MQVEIHTGESIWNRMAYNLDDELLARGGRPLVLSDPVTIPSMCGGKFYRIAPVTADLEVIEKIISEYGDPPRYNGTVVIPYPKYQQAVNSFPDLRLLDVLSSLHCKSGLHTSSRVRVQLSDEPGLYAVHCLNEHVPEVEKQLGYLFDEVGAKKLEAGSFTKWVWGLTAYDCGKDEWDYDYEYDGEWQPYHESREHFFEFYDMLKPVFSREVGLDATANICYVSESFPRHPSIGADLLEAEGVTLCDPRWKGGDIGRAFNDQGVATHYSRRRMIEDVKRMLSRVDGDTQFVHITCNYMMDYNRLSMSIERIGQWLWPRDIPGLSHVELTFAENPNEFMHDIVMLTLVFPEGVQQ